MSASSLVVDLSIEAEEFVRLYQGAARDVFARATNGKTIRFPANILRPYVLSDGVHGRFRIAFDASGKFLAIERVA